MNVLNEVAGIKNKCGIQKKISQINIGNLITEIPNRGI